MRTYSDIEYSKGLRLDLHLPESDEFDLFVYMHGGGLTGGAKNGARVFAQSLAEKNIATASIEYRLYPNARFPDFIEDSALAIRWIFDNISSYGRLGRLFVGGSSAGGYISMMLCFDDKYLTRVGVNPESIAGYVHDAGQPTSHFNVLRELGQDSRRVIVDETAPIYFVGMKEKYPPMLFIVSDNDMTCRYEQTILMVKTLNHFGHKENVFLSVQNGTHCAYTYKVNGEGKSVFADIMLPFFNKFI